MTPATSAAGTPSIETPEASMVPASSTAMSKRAVSPDRLAGGRRRRDPGRRVDVEPDAARAGDRVRARAARCRGRSPISSLRDRVGVAGLAGGAVALHQERGGPGGVRCRGRGADHRDAGPDGGRCGRDDVGLEAAVLRRPLRRVGGRGVALPVAGADRERSARVSGRRDARRHGGLVAQLDAAAEDLEVADDARRALLDAQAVGAGRRPAGSPRSRRAARRRPVPGRTRRASPAPCR